MDIFDRHLIRPTDAQLYFSRKDERDPRLGERTRRASSDFSWAEVVLLGSPHDEGVKRNGGRPGAAAGPTEIRRWLYRLTTNGIDDLHVFDLGDIVAQDSLEATMALQRQCVQRLLVEGKRVVVMGGGNEISYADCGALATVVPRMLALNIDAHFDVREGKVLTSGSPYRLLLQENLLKPGNFYEIGYQPHVNSTHYGEYLRILGVNLCSAAQYRELGGLAAVRRLLKARKDAEAIFWGFDLDVVRSDEAPGVSAPNAIGLTGDELCQLAALAGSDPRSRVIEFSEVNPSFDIDGRTARLTAVAIYHYLAALAKTFLT